MKKLDVHTRCEIGNDILDLQLHANLFEDSGCQIAQIPTLDLAGYGMKKKH